MLVNQTRNYRLLREYEKYACDRCGFTFLKKDLNKQKGMLVCDVCFDEPNPQDERREP